MRTPIVRCGRGGGASGTMASTRCCGCVPEASKSEDEASVWTAVPPGSCRRFLQPTLARRSDRARWRFPGQGAGV